jgi:hypothetical protein
MLLVPEDQKNQKQQSSDDQWDILERILQQI